MAENTFDFDAAIDNDWSETEVSGSDIDDVESVVEETETDTEETDVEETAETEETEEEVEESKENTETETLGENTETETEVEETPKTFTLKHLDEVREGVTEDEVISLAQKGMDYDRIRARADGYEEFLKEMAQGRTIEELMDTVRAARIAKETGVDNATAMERVKLDREKKELAAERERMQSAKSAEEAAEARRKADFADFIKVHPDIKADAIPKEVWADVNKGKSLNDAWDKYETKQMREEIKKLRTENETLKQNEKNKSRSTGSRKTAGSKSAEADFDASWYDGT